MTPRYRINLDVLSCQINKAVDKRDSSTDSMRATGSTDVTGSTDATGSMDAPEGSHVRGETGRMDATQTVIDSSTPTTLPPAAGRTRPSVVRAVEPLPVQQIVELYHEVLPELPRIRLLPDSRLKAMRRRWAWVLNSRMEDGTPRAANASEAMIWFRRYFERVRYSDFLMGRVVRPVGHQGWQCDLDYLLSDKGLKIVIEKTKEPE